MRFHYIRIIVLLLNWAFSIDAQHRFYTHAHVVFGSMFPIDLFRSIVSIKEKEKERKCRCYTLDTMCNVMCLYVFVQTTCFKHCTYMPGVLSEQTTFFKLPQTCWARIINMYVLNVYQWLWFRGIMGNK